MLGRYMTEKGARQPITGLTVTVLAGQTGLARSTLDDGLQQLVQDRLVTRYLPAPGDRAYVYVVTARGRQALWWYRVHQLKMFRALGWRRTVAVERTDHGDP